MKLFQPCPQQEQRGQKDCLSRKCKIHAIASVSEALEHRCEYYADGSNIKAQRHEPDCRNPDPQHLFRRIKQQKYLIRYQLHQYQNG